MARSPRRKRIDYRDYPPNWKTEIRPAVLARAGDRCEGSPRYPDCRAENGQPHPVTGSRVVLTIAHKHGTDKMTTDLGDLMALCQRCHLTYDLEHHIHEAAVTRRIKRRNNGQLELPMIDYSPVPASDVLERQETIKAILREFFYEVYAQDWGAKAADDHAQKIPWHLMDKYTEQLLVLMVALYREALPEAAPEKEAAS